MKLTFATVAFIGLTQACSYTENYWLNDATCSGEPSGEDNYDVSYEDLNVCSYDSSSESQPYYMITRCSGGVYSWAAYGPGDETCATLPGVYSIPSGECRLIEFDGEDKWYGKIVITEEEVAPINTLLELLQ